MEFFMFIGRTAGRIQRLFRRVGLCI